MKYTLFILLSFFIISEIGTQDRFPKPDFESGYQYPEIEYFVPNQALWTNVDLVVLTTLLLFVAFTLYKKRTRKPIIWVAIFSVAYFGFFREGCVCSIGAVQNIALALADETYILPLSALLFFILPVLFTFLFGRLFCSGVCPFGALQELVNIRNYKIPRAICSVLELIPWLYLIFAILFAVTRSRFIICHFDPFIGIFRLGGDIELIVFGVALLVMAIFTGRPFCRFICPYGALLSLFSRVSIWKIQLPKTACDNCQLCHNACPVDAIRPPFDNKVKESRMQGVKRILTYFALLPLIIFTGAMLLRQISGELSRVHKDVRLYEMVKQQEVNPQTVLSVDLEAFYGLGGSVEELAQKCDIIQGEFRLYSTVAGAFIGLVIGLSFVQFSIKRTRKLYEIDHAACIECGKCFSYCPQNQQPAILFQQ